MRNLLKIKRYWVYAALFAFAVCVSIMGYRQMAQVRSEKSVDLTTWVPKKRIVQLMQFHGTDGLKVTPDEVYILRGTKWVPVLKRHRG